MVVIERHVTVRAAPDKVGSLVSALDREPEIWRGTKAVRTLSTQGAVVERERVRLEPPSRIVHELLKGPMPGTKTVVLTPRDDGTDLSAIYDVRLTGFPKLGTGHFARHAGEGTEHALERIKTLAEGRTPPE